MEEEQNIVPQESELKRQFTTVTPLSKYLAMALFVALPFLGFWVGYSYAPVQVIEHGKYTNKIEDPYVGKETPVTVTIIETATYYKRPKLLWCRDEDGDLRSYKEVVSCSSTNINDQDLEREQKALEILENYYPELVEFSGLYVSDYHHVLLRVNKNSEVSFIVVDLFNEEVTDYFETDNVLEPDDVRAGRQGLISVGDKDIRVYNFSYEKSVVLKGSTLEDPYTYYAWEGEDQSGITVRAARTGSITLAVYDKSKESPQGEDGIKSYGRAFFNTLEWGGNDLSRNTILFDEISSVDGIETESWKTHSGGGNEYVFKYPEKYVFKDATSNSGDYIYLIRESDLPELESIRQREYYEGIDVATISFRVYDNPDLVSLQEWIGAQNFTNYIGQFGVNTKDGNILWEDGTLSGRQAVSYRTGSMGGGGYSIAIANDAGDRIFLFSANSTFDGLDVKRDFIDIVSTFELK